MKRFYNLEARLRAAKLKYIYVYVFHYLKSVHVTTVTNGPCIAPHSLGLLA